MPAFQPFELAFLKEKLLNTSISRLHINKFVGGATNS